MLPPRQPRVFARLACWQLIYQEIYQALASSDEEWICCDCALPRFSDSSLIHPHPGPKPQEQTKLQLGY